MDELTYQQKCAELERILDNLPDTYYRTDANGITTFGTRAIEDWLGYSANELIGKPLSVIYVDAQERSRVLQEILAGKGRYVHVQAQVRTKAGETRWAYTRARALFDAEGQFSGVEGSARDATEHFEMEIALREAEERFMLFMEHSPSLAWFKDVDGKYVYRNGKFAGAFGIALPPWQGKDDWELWPASVAAEFRKHDQEVLASWRATEYIETTLDPDGSKRHWLTTKFPFRDRRGDSFVGGIALDITERHRYQERIETEVLSRTQELRELTRRLTVVEERERQAIGRELHDGLCQLLALIKIKLSTLRSDTQGGIDTEGVIGSLDAIAGMVDQADELTRNVSTQLSPFPIQPIELTSALNWLVGSLAKMHPVHFSVKHVDMPLRITEADAKLAYRTTRELVLNAIKHSQSSQIDLLTYLQEGRLVVIVTDGGIGFCPADEFKPTASGGYGLFSIKESLAQVGGTLIIDSDKGNGAVAVVTIPLNNDQS